MPALVYPIFFSAATTLSPISSRVFASTAGEGDSSISFWWRRWMLHSRSPRCMTSPYLSPST